MQCGGDDQWSNMLVGTELIRRKLGANAYAMTANLLMTSDGKKMGKTAKGAVWLDPNKTTPFEFYQYWRNVNDADVIKLLKCLTFLPLEQIAEMESWEGSQLNRAKEILAFELTRDVHGEEEAIQAQEAAKALFADGANMENIPSVKVSEDVFVDGCVDVITLMQKADLAASRSEARRNIEQGGVEVNGVKVTELGYKVEKASLIGEGIILRRGKKKFVRVHL